VIVSFVMGVSPDTIYSSQEASLWQPLNKNPARQNVLRG